MHAAQQWQLSLVLELKAKLWIETLSYDSLQLSKSSDEKLTHVLHIVVLV